MSMDKAPQCKYEKEETNVTEEGSKAAFIPTKVCIWIFLKFTIPI